MSSISKKTKLLNDEQKVNFLELPLEILNMIERMFTKNTISRLNKYLNNVVDKRLVINDFYEGDITINENVVILIIKTDNQLNITLPPYLQKFIIGCWNRNITFSDLPKTLTVLKFNRHIKYSKKIPISIEEMTVSNKNINPSYKELVNLKKLKILGKFTNVEFLPSNLQELFIETTELEVLDLRHLSNLVKLNFEFYTQNYQESPLLILPNSLKYLKLGKDYNHPIELPENLETLILGFAYNSPIVLNEKLKYLRIQQLFDQKLIIPDSLETLVYFDNWQKKLFVGLPKSVKLMKDQSCC